MSKKITLLGSTGSIGTQSLDVIRAQGYEVYGLSAHSHVEKILQQIEEFHPKYVCMTDPDAAAKLDAALAGRANAPKLLTGPEGLKELAALDGPDVVLNSVVGIAGLGASLCAIERPRLGVGQQGEPCHRRSSGHAGCGKTRCTAASCGQRALRHLPVPAG